MDDRPSMPRQTDAPRDPWRAIWRGMRGRCPQCGEGRMFRAYLKVADACPVCGEDLFHQRADDAPPYITIFIVAHIVIGLLLMADRTWPELPFAVHAVVWSIMTIVLSLVILPIAKGGLIGLQWALRMHGFSGETVDDMRLTPSGVRR